MFKKFCSRGSKPTEVFENVKVALYGDLLFDWAFGFASGPMTGHLFDIMIVTKTDYIETSKSKSRGRASKFCQPT